MRSKNKQKKQNSLWNAPLHLPYLIPNHSPTLCFNEIFGAARPIVLEIGFGDGEVLVQSARHDPNTHFVGVEIYQVGVINTLTALQKADFPPNVRLFHGDARLFYPLTEDAQFSEIRILYSDPWGKHRHQSRRLIDELFLLTSLTKLCTTGKLLIKTDAIAYGQDIAKLLQNLAAAEKLTWQPKDFELLPSKYERRGRLRHPNSHSFIIQKYP